MIKLKNKVKKEIHLLSELDHPNVVKLIASYEDEHYLTLGECYVFAEFYDGL